MRSLLGAEARTVRSVFAPLTQGDKMKKRAKYYTDEWCPECEREVRIPARTRPHPKCPKCHEPLLPCSACADEEHKTCATCTDGSCNFKLHPGFKKKKTGFTLNALIKLADKAYAGEGAEVLHAHKGWPFIGDTLAQFVATEIKDTFDAWATKEAQLAEAARVMTVARAQLEGVECALLEQYRKILEKKSGRKNKRTGCKSQLKETYGKV